jgi:hypothetical protein
MADPPGAAPVSVPELMREVRARVEARLALAGPDEAARLRLQLLGDGAEIDPELLSRILSGHPGWNVSPDYRIRTHRTGFSRRMVLMLKALVRPGVRLYTDQILERQAQLNSYLVTVCHALMGELARVEDAQAALRQRCEALERKLQQRGQDPGTGA